MSGDDVFSLDVILAARKTLEKNAIKPDAEGRIIIPISPRCIRKSAFEPANLNCPCLLCIAFYEDR